VSGPGAGWIERLGAAWRALPKPAGLRRAISAGATWAMVQLIRRAPLPTRRSLTDLAPGPLLLSGFFGEVIGVGSAARLTAAGLRRAGLHPVLDDLAPQLKLPLYARRAFPMAQPGGVWISHCNAPELQRMAFLYPRPAMEGRYRIGYWAYELERLPKAWRRTASVLHEIWVPSRFVADAATASLEPGPIISVMPHPTADLSVVRPDRARFGLAPDAFVILSLFDLRSTRARKNPDAAINAYLRAFPEPDGRSLLVCKVVAAEASPQEFEKLKARSRGRRDIVLLTDRLDDAGVWTLIASCDVLLSLHRAEGYGLTLAEAMKLGRCVVATAWSGNMDFMTAENSIPVSYKLVPIDDPQRQYIAPHLVWAEPDVTAAAMALCALAADPTLRSRLGERAREDIAAHEAAFAARLADAPWRRLV
jgi:glycosyltransferase involved in cell wall biosynthesis